MLGLRPYYQSPIVLRGRFHCKRSKRQSIAKKPSFAKFQLASSVRAKPSRSGVRCAAAPDKLTGIVFELFNEAKVELATIDKTKHEVDSIARCAYTPECEAALNEQINVEYNVSYVYHALFAYFDRDNVALPGLAAWFKKQSVEERDHAEKCIEYQNIRGGRVQLNNITLPSSEFHHKEKGDALYAMELALSLEKLNLQKLRQLWAVADRSKDPQLCDFIEGELLAEQVESIKEISEYVSQLRRVGLGHGVYHFDRTLNGADAATE